MIRGFLNRQIKKLKKAGVFEDVEFIEKFCKESLSNYFKKTTILSVPVLKGEAFGNLPAGIFSVWYTIGSACFRGIS
jgi:hypothetical protein